MPGAEFVLEPFPGSRPADGLRVTGTVRRTGAALHVDWRLEAPGEAVAVPDQASRPERRRDLWKETCFEFFLRNPRREAYWEFNLSPSGHWNVFRFAGYRSGMTDETAIGALACSVASAGSRCSASASMDMTALGLAAEPWELAISTVVAAPSGQVSY
ncbi:MAG: hypothetical protein FJZ00_13040, partial [Candidatus Sericytochromatia bacterium]|nr:hypothetical protein [Candidatus Tanganyikabacteria bacterium]